MSARRARVLVAILVAIHIVLLLAYTLPKTFVPQRVQAWSTVIVRPLFHQRWNLFAPDPSPCHCRVEVGLSAADWRPLIPDDRNHVLRHMDRPLAELIRADVERGDTVLRPILADALRGLARDIARDAGPLRYRLVLHCITDPKRPLQRARRIIPLALPQP
ncbi:MAG: hypothetical protein ACO1NQ_03310 [Flavobacteriales bacterium]